MIKNSLIDITIHKLILHERWRALAVTLTTAGPTSDGQQTASNCQWRNLFIDGERWRALAVTITAAEPTSVGQRWPALASAYE